MLLFPLLCGMKLSVSLSLGFSLLILALISCQDKPSHSERFKQIQHKVDPLAPETKAMIDTMQVILSKMDFEKNPYEIHRKLAKMEQDIRKSMEEGRQNFNILDYARLLLSAGRYDECINVIESTIQNDPGFTSLSRDNKFAYDLLSLAYLRGAIHDNCSSQECDFFFNRSHAFRDKSKVAFAIKYLSEILQKFPDDRPSMWLLNLAHAAAGTYPEGLPEGWRISLINNAEQQIKPWKNLAYASKTNYRNHAGGVIADDFDGDGLNDLLICSPGSTGSIKMLKHTGSTGYVDFTAEAGLSGVPGANNMIHADYDNDGDLDFYALRGGWTPYKSWGILPNSLYRNEGNGKFVDVTESAGLFVSRPSQTAVWWDYNNDGWLDLFVGNESLTESDLHPCEFYLNNQDGSFEDISNRSNLSMITNIKGLTLCDINNDGFIDMYASIQGGANKMVVNLGGEDVETWRFVESGEVSGVQDPVISYISGCFDVDEDGYQELVSGEFNFNSSATTAGWLALQSGNKEAYSNSKIYRNNQGTGKFKSDDTEVLSKSSQMFGCGIIDVNNDGYRDIFLGTGTADLMGFVPNQIMINQNGKSWAMAANPNGMGYLQKASGMAVADFNDDGYQDLYVNQGGLLSGEIHSNAMFVNPGGKGQNPELETGRFKIKQISYRCPSEIDC